MKELERQIFGEIDKSFIMKSPNAKGWTASGVPHKSREVRYSLMGDFEASEAVEEMTDILHPAGYHDRIILDFSSVERVKPAELYRLFSELSMLPLFNHLEIRVEGLQFNYWVGKD